ncbi:MAG: hypothetical protein BJ554DRAFT_3791, partial [Olpidium bornovanus]
VRTAQPRARAPALTYRQTQPCLRLRLPLLPAAASPLSGSPPGPGGARSALASGPCRGHFFGSQRLLDSAAMAALADALQPAASEGPQVEHNEHDFRCGVRRLLQADHQLVRQPIKSYQGVPEGAPLPQSRFSVRGLERRTLTRLLTGVFPRTPGQLADGDLLETRMPPPPTPSHPPGPSRPPDGSVITFIFCRADPTKRNMVANESKVEDIIRGRTLKAFHERCRLFQIPEEFYSSR